MTTERGKTICFIDESNFYHGQVESGWKIDWKKFQEYLGRNGQVWQTFYFGSAFEPDDEIRNSFYQHLADQLRWEVTLYALGRKTVLCSHCGHKEVVPAEKGVDVGVATKMLMLGMNRAYETAVLVAGDRDYLEPVRFVKSLGLRVEVVSWKHSLSDELAAESSAPVLLLDELKKAIAFREGSG